MNESFELDERKRNEVVNTLYRSLMDGWDIPPGHLRTLRILR